MNEMQYPKYRWFVLLALSLVAMATVGNIVAPATMIGEIAKTTGLSMGVAAIAAMGMIDLSTGLSGLVGGFAADRWGVGKVWMAGFALLILGSLLMPFYGDSFWGLSLIRVLHGCGAGPIVATSPLVAMQWFPPKDRGMIIGVQGTMVSVGAGFSLMFVPRMFELTGQWPVALAWMAALSTLGLVMAIALTAGPKPPAPPKPAAPPPPKPGALGLGELLGLLRQPSTVAAVLCGFFFSWEVRAFNDLIPNYLAVAQPVGIGLGPLRAGETMSVVQLPFMIGPLIGGFLADRVFRGSIRLLIMACFIVSAIAAYALGLPGVTGSYALLLVALSVCGFAMSITSPQVMTFVIKNNPEHMVGKLGGIIMGCSILGGVAGVAACSWALHHSGGYAETIALIAIAPVLAAFAAIFLVSRKGNEASSSSPDAAAAHSAT